MSFHDMLLRAAASLSGEPDDAECHRLGHELGRHAGEDPAGLRGFLARIAAEARGNPGPILDALRRLRPVLVVRGIAIVTDYPAVTSVLANHHDFAVPYGPKMSRLTEGDNFFLGQDDDEPAGALNRALTSLLFRREDAARRIPGHVARIAEECLASSGTTIDAIADYLRVVPPRFAAEYFGLRRIEPARLIQLTETLFEYLFIDIANDPDLGSRAEAAGSELLRLLEYEIADKARPNEDTVIARGQALVASGIGPMGARALRNNLFGLLIGLVPTTGRAAAMALDYLTLDPHRRAALTAALADADSFAGTILEGMRLNPINPGLLRIARCDARVPFRSGHATIPEGTTVFAATISAMRDPSFVPDPDRIDPSRPPSVYLLNGHGLHACFGRYVNAANVTTLLRVLLEAGFARLPGEAGDLVFEGPFPARMAMERPRAAVA